MPARYQNLFPGYCPPINLTTCQNESVEHVLTADMRSVYDHHEFALTSRIIASGGYICHFPTLTHCYLLILQISPKFLNISPLDSRTLTIDRCRKFGIGFS